MTLTAAAEIDALRVAMIGSVLLPTDQGYDDARNVWNGDIDRHPAVIARCESAADVAAAIDFARRHGLEISVRGGGHNAWGASVGTGGMMIHLGGLNAVKVDPAARRVRVGGGAMLADLDAATQAHGLATTAGTVSHTGVGGLTLGGGFGWLGHRHGFAIDNLVSAEVVTADGRIMRASQQENPDLFWALRGGGGNFGVVTSFLFRLHEVDTVVGGPTFWAVEQAEEVLEAYRDFLPDARRELNGFFAFASVPPAPPFPGELHLRKVCGVVWCYAGDPEDAAAAMAPLLDVLPEPLLHAPQPMPHPALQGAFDPVYPAGDHWYWRADFVKEIPDEAVEVHARFGAAMPTWQSTMHLYPIDGAAHDVGASETPWSYRDANWGSVFAGVSSDPAEAEAIRRWCVDYFEALHPFAAGGAYVNMMMDEGQERVRASYRDNYERLAEIKATYDPDNLFRVNQNIAPAG